MDEKQLRASGIRTIGYLVMNLRTPALLLLFALLTPGAATPNRCRPSYWMERSSSPDKARGDEAVEELGKWGERDPSRVVPLLERALQRAPSDAVLAVRLEPEAAALAKQPDPMQTLQELLALLVHQRLRLAEYVVLRVVADEEGVRATVRPAARHEGLDEGLRRLVADADPPGAIELLRRAPRRRPSPSARATRVAVAGRRRPRTRRGSPPRRSASRRRRRRASATSPATPGHRLARRAPRRIPGPVPGAPGDAERPRPARRARVGRGAGFTEGDLVFEPRDDAGFPALFVSATPARASDFRAFLKAHAGLDLWLVMDGTAVALRRRSRPIPATRSRSA